MERKSVTANKKLRCLQRKNPLLFSAEMFPYSFVLISIYLFNYPEVSACCPPPPLSAVSDLLFVPEKHIQKKTWIAGWPHARFCGSLFIGPPGEGWRGGEGAATRKIYRVFLRTSEGQSPGEGRGGEKAKLLVHLFRRRYAEDDVGTPPQAHTLHKWCAACVYET